MKSLVVLTVVWVMLALSTLTLVVKNESSLVAALVAWTGGLITYRLAARLISEWNARHTPV